jgi:hypothetical protein
MFDDAAKRRVRNGRHKKALPGSAWGGDRDSQQNSAGKRGQSQASGHTESLTTFFTGRLLPVALALQGFKGAGGILTLGVNCSCPCSSRGRGEPAMCYRKIHYMSSAVFQRCKIPERQRIVKIALRTAYSEVSVFTRDLYFDAIERLFGWDQAREERNLGKRARPS